MDKKYWLLIIFAITFISRLIVAFTIPNFTYDSYFHLRQVEHITETGIPLYQDPLSYGGRTLFFLPAFHYLMAFFDLFLPLELAAKILPNLLVSSLVFLVYLISKRITKHETASLLSSFIIGFLPILFTPNFFSPITLFLPLIFLAIYCFMRINEQKFLYLYILSLLIASFTSSATFLLIIGFGIYLILSKLEAKKVDKAELELIFFSALLCIWTQFLFFKNVFVEEGISFIWRNVPANILMEYFPRISILELMVQLSIVPLIAGMIIVYQALFRLKNMKSFLLISLVISTALLAWLRLIELNLSLIFFGSILAVLFSPFYKETYDYIQKTRFLRLKKSLSILIVLLIVLTVVYPTVTSALQQEVPTEEETEAFKWISDNTPSSSGVLALLEEGHLVTYYSHRRNLMDDQFHLITNVDERFNDLNYIFTTSFETEAINLLDKYDLQYVILTPQAKEKYEIFRLNYGQPQCFQLVYKNETKIYKARCIIERVQS